MATLLRQFSLAMFDDVVAQAETCGAVLPSCKYVSHCPPPLDCCDVMAFYPERVDDIADPGSSLKCSVNPKVTFSIELWYCISLPSISSNGFAVPDPAVASSEALEMQDAAYTVYDAVLSSGGGCGGLDSISMECLDPQGGCAGWKITATTDLEVN